MTPKCTSRPDCPCHFCVRVRAEIAEGLSDKENQLAEDFLRSCADRARGEEMVKKSVHLAPEDSTESETIESDVWKIQGPRSASLGNRIQIVDLSLSGNRRL
jgi:hypothetical protein